MAFQLKGVRRDFSDFHGFVYLDEETYPGIITISYFFITTADRRKGHGKRLVQHLEELAGKQGKDLVFVCVAPESETPDGLDSPMCELLRSLGYRYMDQSIHMCKNPNLNTWMETRFPCSETLRRLEEYTSSTRLERTFVRRPDGAWVCELVLGLAMMTGIGWPTKEEAEESAARLMVDYLNKLTPQQQLDLFNPDLWRETACLVK